MDRKTLAKRNLNIRKYVDYPSRAHRGCVRYNIHNSPEHEMTKAKVCWELKQLGFEFISECQLFSGNIADVFVTDTGTVIEILHSETDKRFKEKTKRFKEGIKIIKLKTEKWSKDDLICIG